MVIHEELLKKAQEAGARLSETERQVQLARAEYHAIIRRIHLAGASLREIAHELGLSHQRVQQMVDSAGGSWWQRVWRTRNARGDLACSFCRKPQVEVARLIAGPKVFICDSCVATAEKSMTGSGGLDRPVSLALAVEGSRARCSFCSKRRMADRQLLTGPAGSICSDCLNICRQILTDSGA